MSSSDEGSPALQFSRSIRARTTKARVMAEDSDEENRPPSADDGLQTAVDGQRKPYAAPIGSLKSLKNAGATACKPCLHQADEPCAVQTAGLLLDISSSKPHIRTAVQPRGEELPPCGSTATASCDTSCQNEAAKPSPAARHGKDAATPNTAAVIINADAVTANRLTASPDGLQFTAEMIHGQGPAVSPCTPGTPQAAALDIDDPFTPWLRTAQKPGRAGALHSSGAEQEGVVSSPLSFSSSSSSGSWQLEEQQDGIPGATIEHTREATARAECCTPVMALFQTAVEEAAVDEPAVGSHVLSIVTSSALAGLSPGHDHIEYHDSSPEQAGAAVSSNTTQQQEDGRAGCNAAEQASLEAAAPCVSPAQAASTTSSSAAGFAIPTTSFSSCSHALPAAAACHNSVGGCATTGIALEGLFDALCIDSSTDTPTLSHAGVQAGLASRLVHANAVAACTPGSPGLNSLRCNSIDSDDDELATAAAAGSSALFATLADISSSTSSSISQYQSPADAELQFSQIGAHSKKDCSGPEERLHKPAVARSQQSGAAVAGMTDGCRFQPADETELVMARFSAAHMQLSMHSSCASISAGDEAAASIAAGSAEQQPLAVPAIANSSEDEDTCVAAACSSAGFAAAAAVENVSPFEPNLLAPRVLGFLPELADQQLSPPAEATEPTTAAEASTAVTAEESSRVQKCQQESQQLTVSRLGATAVTRAPPAAQAAELAAAVFRGHSTSTDVQSSSDDDDCEMPITFSCRRPRKPVVSSSSSSDDGDNDGWVINRRELPGHVQQQGLGSSTGCDSTGRVIAATSAATAEGPVGADETCAGSAVGQKACDVAVHLQGSNSTSSCDHDSDLEKQLVFSRRRPARPLGQHLQQQQQGQRAGSSSSIVETAAPEGSVKQKVSAVHHTSASGSCSSSSSDDADDESEQLVFSRRKAVKTSQQLRRRQEPSTSSDDEDDAGASNGKKADGAGGNHGGHADQGYSSDAEQSDTVKSSTSSDNSDSGGSSSAGESSSSHSASASSSDWTAESDSDGNSSAFSLMPRAKGSSSRRVSSSQTPQQLNIGSTAGVDSTAQVYAGRTTPGSSSSLVARRRRRRQSPQFGTAVTFTPGLQQQRKQLLSSWWQQPGGSSPVHSPAAAAAADPYNFDDMMSALTPPETIVGCLQTPGGLAASNSGVGAALGATPCANLSFTPAAAAGAVAAVPWTTAHPGDRRAPAAGGARRLSLGLSPISPPLLKPQVLLGTGIAAAAAGSIGRTAGASSWGSRSVLSPLTTNTSSKTPTATAAGGQAVVKGPAAVVGGTAGKGRKQQQQPAGSKTAPAKAPSSRMFARQRQQLSQQLYDQWNKQVFDGGLPADLPVVWNPRLTSTAGQVVDDGSHNRLKTSREQRIPVRLELSTKVLDTEARLRTTLGHEMCHVAAWVISQEFKQHHGPAFWAWARRFEERVPGIKITTCHNYEIHAPFRWQCMNHECGKMYHRHKRSIDPNRHVCSRCNGRLSYLGKFSRDGKLLGSIAAGAATPGAAAAAAAKTPGAGGNVFSQFVKTHFASIKKGMPAGTPHKEIMSRLATQYKQQKTAAETEQVPGKQQQQQAELVLVDQQQQQQREEEQRQNEASRVDLQEQLDYGNKQQVIESIDLLSDSGASDVDQDESVQQLNTAAEEEGLLTFMQKLDLAG